MSGPHIAGREGAQTVTKTSVVMNGPHHHPSHRRTVRAGTPVVDRISRSAVSACATMLATITTTPRYTRRPRKRTDGGSARLLQPSRPQQRLKRVTDLSPLGAISPPRGLRA